jgi:hypothetical protein
LPAAIDPAAEHLDAVIIAVDGFAAVVDRPDDAVAEAALQRLRAVLRLGNRLCAAE